jgi:hypothetical protein
MGAPEQKKPLSLARKVFLAIAGFGTVVGLGLAVYGSIDPTATTIAVNGQTVTGGTAFVAAIGSGLIPGVIFGAIGAGIAKLFDCAPRRAQAENQD